MPFGPYSSTFSFTTTTLPAPSHTPSPTLAQLRTAVLAWVKDCVPTGWEVIFERQNAPRPSDLATPKPYVTIFFSPLVKRGLRDFQGPVQQLDTDVYSVEMVGDRELTVTLQAFGKDGIQVLEDLRTCLDVESVLAALRAASLAHVESGPILNLTGLYDTQFLERGSLDVRFRTHAATLDQDQEGYIEIVQGEATYQNPPALDIVHPFTVDSTP